MNRETMFNYICNNYDNLEILSFVKDLLFVVINDLEYMNDFENDYMVDYDLGNNMYINNEDLESIVSITDTIFGIEQYNREEKENS